MITGLLVLGFCLVALAYALFLRLAHSPAGTLRFIESSIALRKSLASGAGGRIAIATSGTALLAAALASTVSIPLAATSAAFFMALVTAGLHRFTYALAIASCGRIGQAESKNPKSGLMLARRASLLLASAALGAGTLTAALILFTAQSFIDPKSAGSAASAFVFLYPAVAHLSARSIDASPLPKNPSRLAGLLASLACSVSSFSALALIAPGCPVAGETPILAVGFSAAFVASAAFFLAGSKILRAIARIANP